jgi:thioredoxin-dependent peroxiredoxin
VPRLSGGMKAPAFTLTNQDGQTVSLKDFSGQRVVVYFYPADDTPGCTTEACQFNDELSAFKKLKVNVLGISPDNEEDHVAFRKKFSLTFDLLSDPTKKTMAKYGAFGEKMNYGKKILGVIRSTFVIGPTGTIEHAWYAVHADGHAARVLKSLTP